MLDKFWAFIISCVLSYIITLGLSFIVVALGWPAWVAPIIIGVVLLIIIIINEIQEYRANKRAIAACAMKSTLESFWFAIQDYKEANDDEKDMYRKRFIACANEFNEAYNNYLDRYGADGATFYRSEQYYSIINDYNLGDIPLPLLR